MKTLGSLLSSTLKNLGIEDKVKLEAMRSEWPNIFNEPLSLHTCPVEIKNGELLINVDSPVWLQQLKFFKQEIIKKLHGYSVKDVRFKHGRIYKSGQDASKKKSPEVKKTKKIQDSDILWIDQTVSDINDSELKEALRKTIQKALMRS